MRKEVPGPPGSSAGQRLIGFRWLPALARGLPVLVILAVVATLVGRFGAHFWLLDLAAHFSVIYLLVAVGAAPVLLAAGHRWGALLAVAALALNLWVLIPFRPAPVGACAAPLTILQANVRGSATTAEQFAVWWAEQGLEADILALIEVPPAWEPWLQAQRSAYPWQAGVLRDDPFGLWVLSRRPGVLTVETAVGGIPWVRLDLAGSIDQPPLAVLILHPPPPMNRELTELRNRQLAAVLAPATHPRLVVGDFNLTPWSPWNSILLEAGQLYDAGAGLPPAGTWPAGFPSWLALPIDRTWVSAGWSVAARQVLPARGLPSDHRAVWNALCADAR